jgi:hypothetical protein
MPDLSGLARLIERYPALWEQYKNQPEIIQILAQAADQNWPPERLQQAIQNSAYWKTHSEASRAWDALSAIDPVEAQKRMGAAIKAIQDTAARLGLQLPTGTDPATVMKAMGDIYHVASENMSAAQIADYLTVQYSGDPKNPAVQRRASGEILTNMEKIRSMQSDYGLPTNPASNLWHAQNIVRGVETMEAVQGVYAKQAKGLFAPEVGAAIDRGMTVRQFADPYISLAAQNLEIGPDQIDLSDPKWQAFLKVSNPDKTAGVASRVMTMSEWQAHIRSDPQYGFDRTSTARQSAAQLATQLAERFGAI